MGESSVNAAPARAAVRRVLAVLAAALPGEVSWVAASTASTTVVVAQLAWRPVWPLPAGAVVAAGWWLGARAAGQPGEAVAHAVTLVLQTGCAAATGYAAAASGAGAPGADRAGRRGFGRRERCRPDHRGR